MNNTTDTIEVLKQKLSQLKDLHDSGVLAEAQYQEGKATLERRILDLVLSAAPEATTSLATSNASSNAKKQSTMSGKAAAAAYAATAAASAPSTPAAAAGTGRTSAGTPS